MWPYHPWPDPRTNAGRVFYMVVGLAIGFWMAGFR
jgi:hypothetical protein